jgi:acetyltransferase-like isoleucine patch superfamily enzyme
MIRIIVQLLCLLLPWCVRRLVYNYCLGWKIHPSARIGFSLIDVDLVVMGECSRIGHLNVARGLSLLSLERFSLIGSLNWITALPLDQTKHFAHRPNRNPSLVIGSHAAVTSRHYLDCCDKIEIGEYAIVGGIGTQMLTHGIDFLESRQDVAPIRVGKYSFVGTKCVLLKGAALPDFCVLGASALLNRAVEEHWVVYAGIPATAGKAIDRRSVFFHRKEGWVW